MCTLVAQASLDFQTPVLPEHDREKRVSHPLALRKGLVVEAAAIWGESTPPSVLAPQTSLRCRVTARDCFNPAPKKDKSTRPKLVRQAG